jgi:hypothetical protein
VPDPFCNESEVKLVETHEEELQVPSNFANREEFQRFYKDYLKTDWWRTFSQQQKCNRTRCEYEGCNIDDEGSRRYEGKGLNVHHLRYNFYTETPEDVQVLCHWHHQYTHNRIVF